MVGGTDAGGRAPRHAGDRAPHLLVNLDVARISWQAWHHPISSTRTGGASTPGGKTLARVAAMLSQGLHDNSDEQCVWAWHNLEHEADSMFMTGAAMTRTLRRRATKTLTF